MAKQFRTAAAFKASLEAHLRTRADALGVPLSTLQLKFVIERLLARLFREENPPWLLKGGFAMDLRFRPRARTTKDIDLSVSLVAGTGKPLAADVDYYCLVSNPNAADAPGYNFGHAIGAFYTTDEEGRFKIPVLRGRGILIAKLHGRDAWLAGEGSTTQGGRPYAFLGSDLEGLDPSEKAGTAYVTEPGFVLTSNYNAAAVIDPGKAAASVARDLKAGPVPAGPAKKGGKP